MPDKSIPVQAKWKTAALTKDAWAYDIHSPENKEKRVFLPKDQQVVVMEIADKEKAKIKVPNVEDWCFVLLPEGMFILHKSSLDDAEQTSPFSTLIDFLLMIWRRRSELLERKSKTGIWIYGLFICAEKPAADFPAALYFKELDEILKRKPASVRTYFSYRPEEELEAGFFDSEPKKEWQEDVIRFVKRGWKQHVPEISKFEKMRMSLHPLPAYATRVLEFLLEEFLYTDEFPGIGVIKISSFDVLPNRSDSIVVYVSSRREMHDLCQKVEVYVKEHESYFAEDVYKTTIPVAKGVSISDLPLVTHTGFLVQWKRVPTVLLANFLTAIADLQLDQKLTRPLTADEDFLLGQLERNEKDCYRLVREEPFELPRISPIVIDQMISAVKKLSGKDLYAFKDMLCLGAEKEYSQGNIFLRDEHTTEMSYGQLRAWLIADALIKENQSFRAFYAEVYRLFREAKIDFYHPHKNIYTDAREPALS